MNLQIIKHFEWPSLKKVVSLQHYYRITYITGGKLSSGNDLNIVAIVTMLQSKDF